MAANMGKPMPLFGKVFMGIMISITQKILVTKTVSELLFEGYIDPLLSAGRGWPSTSSKVPYDKFGWFYKVCYSLFFGHLSAPPFSFVTAIIALHYRGTARQPLMAFTTFKRVRTEWNTSVLWLYGILKIKLLSTKATAVKLKAQEESIGPGKEDGKQTSTSFPLIYVGAKALYKLSYDKR